MQANEQSQGNELIIARGITKKDGKKPGQVITKLFLDAESTQRVIDQLSQALQEQTDGVSVTVLEGEGQKGAFGMISASSLQQRPDRPQAQQRAYTAPQGQQAPRPQAPAQGGYRPKTPGYSRGK
jgi:hypothetical protein